VEWTFVEISLGHEASAARVMTSKSKKKDASDDLSNSILAKLVEEHGQKSADEEFANDVTILFCGAKKSGKTSVVDRFINPTKDEKDQPKQTVALEYKFARYASDGASSKVLAHIYDLGGDDDLISVPIAPSTIGNLVLSVTLDLSEPHTCMASLEKWLKMLRTQLNRSLQTLAQENPSSAKRIEALQALRGSAYAEHPDRGVINPFPVPLVLFGTKWDALAADTDPEKRKNLCRALRYFALVNGASLVFTSAKEKSSLNNMRTILRQLLFGVAPKGGFPEQLDHAKPLAVFDGTDSIGSIGAPPNGQASDRSWREQVEHMFPDPTSLNHKGAKKTESDQVGEELMKFPESSVDGMVEQRTEELQQYRRQVERNQRLASEGVDVGKILINAAS